MKNVNTNGFNEHVLNSKGLVLLFLWAQWSSPCDAISESLQQIEIKHPDIKFIKIDADRNKLLAAELNVRSIPTLIVFRNGVATSTQVGVVSKSKLEKWIETILTTQERSH